MLWLASTAGTPSVVVAPLIARCVAVLPHSAWTASSPQAGQDNFGPGWRSPRRLTAVPA